jgi:hypothetical protein
MSKLVRIAVVAFLLLPAAPALAGVRAGHPFPSDLFTVADASQLTGLRVALPKPNCAVRPSDCADLDVLNDLDGFNVDARVSLAFDGPIDLSTVSSDTVFLVDASGNRVGIDKIVWTAATSTLHAQPANLLNQHTSYVLVATDGVRAADGSAIEPDAFRHDLAYGKTKDLAAKAYRKRLLAALHWTGLSPGHIVSASLFTTQSITSILEKIRAQIDATTAAPVTFALGPGGSPTVFPFASVAGLVFTRQVGTSTFTTSTLPAAVPVFPGAIGTVAFGRFASPDYETTARVIPGYGTRTGVPVAMRTNDIYVNLYLPSGAKPAGGWPVAIFGHGFTDSK